MIELSRTQDEEVGDGTTSVIILGKWPAIFESNIMSQIAMLYFLVYILHLFCTFFGFRLSQHKVKWIKKLELVLGYITVC